MADLSSYAHHMSRILKVLVYIEDHLDEELSLKKMAKIAHISPFYFHRLFHAYMGETLAEYIKRLRLQCAAGRLQYSDSPITDIALDLGYESPAAFTKVFHQVIGKSPRQYRQVIQAIMRRTLPIKEPLLKPEYVNRKEETLFFIRKVGDYQNTPWAAFQTLFHLLQEEKISPDKIQACYSMGLDDPSIVERSKCRFDACVALQTPFFPKGEMGLKTLAGGRFAVFLYRGLYSELENVFDDIFCSWYPTSKEQLSEDRPFCEHIKAWDHTIPDQERITKLFIPLK